MNAYTTNVVPLWSKMIRRGAGLVRHNRVMWQADLDAFVQYLHAAGRAPTTIRLRRMHLERAFVWVNTPPLEVVEDQLLAYLAANDWKPETRKSVRASLCGFYAWAVKTERLVVDPSRNLPSVSVPQGTPHPTPDRNTHAALAAADDDLRLMIMLAAYAGLRRAEIASLHSRNVVGDLLRVTGKGGKERDIPAHPDLLAALAGRSGFIFPGEVDGHLSPDWVGKRLKRALGDGWTAHSLRHRFATRAYAGERDLLTVQQLLGHSSVATTQRYTQVPDDARRRAIASVA